MGNYGKYKQPAAGGCLYYSDLFADKENSILENRILLEGAATFSFACQKPQQSIKHRKFDVLCFTQREFKTYLFQAEIIVNTYFQYACSRSVYDYVCRYSKLIDNFILF